MIISHMSNYKLILHILSNVILEYICIGLISSDCEHNQESTDIV